MSINHARSAAADFSSMRAAFARRWIASDPEMRAQLDESVDAWRRSLAEDLEVAAQRSQSKRAAQAAFNVQRAAINWNEVRLRLIADIDRDANWATLDHYTRIVNPPRGLLLAVLLVTTFLLSNPAAMLCGPRM